MVEDDASLPPFFLTAVIVERIRQFDSSVYKFIHRKGEMFYGRK